MIFRFISMDCRRPGWALQQLARYRRRPAYSRNEVYRLSVYSCRSLEVRIAERTWQRAMPKIAPYGRWKSPITSDLIVAQSIGSRRPVSTATMSTGWRAGRRSRAASSSSQRCAGTAATDLTPKPFNARTRVHEYGGASWTVVDGVVYFSNFADGRLYRTRRRRVCAGGADAGSERSRTSMAICRRHHRSWPQSLDRRARRPHGRRRSGEHDRGRRSGAAGPRRRPGAGRRPRFLCSAAPVA